jgi:predicted site-specific integrase-resolvase
MSTQNISNLPELLTTEEMAKILRISRQTARRWSMTGAGPLQPVKFFARGPLKWRRDQVLSIINQGSAPTSIMDRNVEC